MNVFLKKRKSKSATVQKNKQGNGALFRFFMT